MDTNKINLANDERLMGLLRDFRNELSAKGYEACLDVSGGAQHALSVSLIVSPTAEDALAARTTLAWGDELSHANVNELASRMEDRRGLREDMWDYSKQEVKMKISKKLLPLIELLVAALFGWSVAFLLDKDQRAVGIFGGLMSSCGIVFLLSRDIKTQFIARLLGMACAAAFSISFFRHTWSS